MSGDSTLGPNALRDAHVIAAETERPKQFLARHLVHECQRDLKWVNKRLAIPPIVAQESLEFFVAVFGDRRECPRRPLADLIGADRFDKTLFGHLIEREMHRTVRDVRPLLGMPCLQFAANLVAVCRGFELEDTEDQQPGRRYLRDSFIQCCIVRPRIRACQQQRRKSF